MKRINSLNDLLMEELADLLDAERQLIMIFSKLAEASQSSALKIILEDHLEATKEQAHRLEDIFSNIGQNSKGETCKVMKDFIVESEDVIEKTEKCPARDSTIISIVQRMEKYEITGYQTACEHASDLGHTRMVELLNKTLEEERVMNFHLNELAQYMINVQAINPFDPQQSVPQESPSQSKGGGFYVPEGKFDRGGIKKRSKGPDIFRFKNEEDPKQESKENGQEKGDKNSQN